jgi:hypothetical protein
MLATKSILNWKGLKSTLDKRTYLLRESLLIDWSLAKLIVTI